MGFTNMLLTLAVLITYSKTHMGSYVHSPSRKMAANSIFNLKQVEKVGGRQFRGKIKTKIKTLKPWKTVKLERKAKPYTFLNSFMVTPSIQARVAKALDQVEKPFGVLHPRLEGDWVKDRDKKHLNFFG